MSVLDYFIGTQQSKYAAIAIFSAIFVICMAVLFTNTDVPLENRILVVFFVFLMSIIPVGMSLFELTCIVTGSKNKPYNMCNIFAWVVAIVMISYSFILIISVILSMFTYKKAIYKLEADDSLKVVPSEDADKIAKNMIEDESEDRPQVSPEIPARATEETPKQEQSNTIGGFDKDNSFMELEQQEVVVDNKEPVEHFVSQPDSIKKNEPEPFSMDDSFASI
jgi:hypothetical protein